METSEEVVEAQELNQSDAIGADVSSDEPAEKIESSPGGNEKIEISAEEYEKLNARLTQQEEFIKRRNTDVGSSRAKVAELEAEVEKLRQARNQLKDDGLPDPFEAIENYNALSAAERSLAEENARLIEENNRIYFKSVDPAYEKRIDKMAEIMLASGESQEAVNHFKTNPYQVDQGIASAYRLAAESAMELEEARSVLNKLDPKGVAAKIQAAAKGGASVTAATGGGSSGDVEVTRDMLRTATKNQLRHFHKTGEWTNP